MNLRIHNRQRHKDKHEKQKSSESTQINCKFCDFRNGMRALVAHMKSMHPQEALFECDVCSYKRTICQTWTRTKMLNTQKRAFSATNVNSKLVGKIPSWTIWEWSMAYLKRTPNTKRIWSSLRSYVTTVASKQLPRCRLRCTRKASVRWKKIIDLLERWIVIDRIIHAPENAGNVTTKAKTANI